MGKASSNKKVARAAKAGGGVSRRSRSTSWSFTGAVAAIVLAGVALIVGSIIGRSSLFTAPYNGQSSEKYKNEVKSAQKEYQKLASAKKPDAKKVKAALDKVNTLTSDSHWHSAYGFFDCDHFVKPVDASGFTDPAGIHSHEDGLMHIHPFVDRVAGKKARLGVWLDAIHASITSKKISFPADATGVKQTVWDLSKKKCGGKEAEIKVLVWRSAKDASPVPYTGDFRSIPLAKDGAYAFVFALKATKIPIPATVKSLEAPSDLATTSTTTPGSTIEVGGTTTTLAPGATTTLAPGATTTVAATAGATGASTTAPAKAPTTTVPAAADTTAASAVTPTTKK